MNKDRETRGQIGSGAIIGPLVWALKKQLWIETNVVENITDLVCDRQRKSSQNNLMALDGSQNNFSIKRIWYQSIMA